MSFRPNCHFERLTGMIISTIVSDKSDIYRGKTELQYSIFVFLESVVDHTDS